MDVEGKLPFNNDRPSPAGPAWPVIGALGVLAAGKFATVFWPGGWLLPAQAGYTAGECFLLAALLPALHCPPAHRINGGGKAARTLLFALAIFMIGAAVLRLGGLLLSGKIPVGTSPALPAALLFFAAVELPLLLHFSARGRRENSPVCRFAAGSLKNDLIVLVGVAGPAVTAGWGHPAIAGIAAAGLGVLILRQAVAAARYGLTLLL